MTYDRISISFKFRLAEKENYFLYISKQGGTNGQQSAVMFFHSNIRKNKTTAERRRVENLTLKISIITFDTNNNNGILKFSPNWYIQYIQVFGVIRRHAGAIGLCVIMYIFVIKGESCHHNVIS